MKITCRLATTEYSYIEVEFETLAEFDQHYHKLRQDAQMEKKLNEVPFPAKTYPPNSVGATLNPPQAPVSGFQPRNVKTVGSPCQTCSTPLIQGAKGVYCKPCYFAWKSTQPQS